jgi:hypothetical protein
MKRMAFYSLLSAFAVALFLARHAQQRDSRNPSSPGDKDTKQEGAKFGTRQDAPPSRLLKLNTRQGSESDRSFRLGYAGTLDTIERGMRDYRQQMQERDIQLGSNAQVRDRETEMRGIGLSLRTGMPRKEAMELLGKPARIGLSVERRFFDLVRSNAPPEQLTSQLPPTDEAGRIMLARWLTPDAVSRLPDGTHPAEEILLIYSPHSDERDFWMMSDSFQLLHLWFDRISDRLLRFEWRNPQAIR